MSTEISGYQQNISRVVCYAERFFQRSGKTEFPTVRQVARALRLQQSEVEQIAQDCDARGLSFDNVEWKEPVGGWFVEVYAEDAK